MKRLLLGTGVLVALANAATSADLYTKARPAPAPIMPPPFSWTGFYIGPNIGASWEYFDIANPLTSLSFGSGTRSAFIGGGQVGFNYQVSPSSFSASKDFSMALRATTTPALGFSFQVSA